MGQENCRRERAHRGHLQTDDAALVDTAENSLVTFRDRFTGPMVLTIRYLFIDAALCCAPPFASASTSRSQSASSGCSFCAMS